MIKKIFIFLIINFSALAIGSIYTKTAVMGRWYTQINKAPWTPPGYMFGLVWSIIMVCFALYMACLWSKVSQKNLLKLFAIQWILNVGWNPVFFYFEKPVIGLIILVLLTSIIAIFMFKYFNKLKLSTLLLLPYFIWLLIAISLNGYIVFYN